MGIAVQVFPARGLVFVRYDGIINIAESNAAFAGYMADPGYLPGQRQLIDLRDATGWEPDFPRLMALQARKAEAIAQPGYETLFVYHAPDDTSRAIAQTVLRSWDGVGSVVPLIIDTEAEALAVLGQPERSFADLLQSA
ncbi:hypothetical protein [Sinisalibacter aestuarii]|nr:hypothetical protein [Sinisalibacter aestuarii]